MYGVIPYWVNENATFLYLHSLEQPTPSRFLQTLSRTAPVPPQYRKAPVKMSVPDLHLRKDRQTGCGPKENTPGTISPSASSMPKSPSPTSTAQLPPWSGQQTAPGIISKTTARHRARMGDWGKPAPPRAGWARCPELCTASLPARSGSPGCCWPGPDRLRPCTRSLHRGCTAACNAPCSRAKEGLAGRSYDEMMCKITSLVFTEDRDAGRGQRNRP